MRSRELNVVTAAFGYIGQYIAARLLSMGKEVRTLTRRPESESPFSDRVSALPFHFDDPTRMRESLRGATTLYKTYWIRLERGEAIFANAVENTLILLNAAQEAGLRRIVHVSIANASQDSPLPYFRAKRALETAIIHYAIIRPTVAFGTEEILINNIIWLLRSFPLFPVFGSGGYPVQPIYVEDVADLAARAGQQDEHITVEAAGPERYTFEEMVRLIREKLHSRARIIHLPPRLGLLLARFMGIAVRDLLLTPDELNGLMAGFLVSQDRPAGCTHLSAWLDQNTGTLGLRYASELDRHYR